MIVIVPRRHPHYPRPPCHLSHINIFDGFDAPGRISAFGLFSPWAVSLALISSSLLVAFSHSTALMLVLDRHFPQRPHLSPSAQLRASGCFRGIGTSQGLNTLWPLSHLVHIDVFGRFKVICDSISVEFRLSIISVDAETGFDQDNFGEMDIDKGNYAVRGISVLAPATVRDDHRTGRQNFPSF
jgi:hypothetical protein